MRPYIMTVALPALAMFALAYTARTPDRTYAGFNCTVDCSGHEAGFHEGCIAYVEGEPQANDNGISAGMPMITDPDDDDDK